MAQEKTDGVGAQLARLHTDLNHPTRLAMLAGLRGRQRAEFKLVRDSLGVSDSVMSRQMSTLEKAGLLAVDKGFVGRRPRTWLSITSRGHTVLEEHLAALRELATADFGDADADADSDPDADGDPDADAVAGSDAEDRDRDE